MSRLVAAAFAYVLVCIAFVDIFTALATLACALAARLLLRWRRRVALRRALLQQAQRKRRERDLARAAAAAAGLDWAGLRRWAETRAAGWLSQKLPSPEEVVQMSACGLLEAMKTGRLSSEFITRCFVARAMECGELLECNAEEPFEAAVEEAALCDAERAAGKLRGPLHGLPISVKDQVGMKGFDSTCGLACRTFDPAGEDSVIVAAARAAGAIPFVRTSVPQLLMLPETFNAVWGVAKNPWDVARTPGGSSGGEGALLAARGSPLGIGTDVGGSIRIPASMCGICGFKPTVDRLSYKGVSSPRRERASGQKEIRSCPGPMGRSVDDLELLLSVWCAPAAYDADPTIPRVPWDRAAYLAASARLSAAAPPAQGGAPRKLRFGVLRADGWFAAAPACARALDEAAAAVAAAGHELVEVPAAAVDGMAAALAYAKITWADGKLRSFVEALEGEAMHPAYAFMHAVARLPDVLRPALAAALSLCGEARKAAVVKIGCGRDAYDYWQAVLGRDELRANFLAHFQRERLDALLTPALGMPALPLFASRELLICCSFTFVFNNFNCPAGTLPVSAVRPDEQHYADPAWADSFCKVAAKASAGSAGLPVGVQVVGLPWRDEATLGAMRVVERCLAAAGRGAQSDAVPPHPPLPPSKGGGKGGA